MTITFSQLGNMGRVGNAIFELSAAIALAKRNNDSVIFPHWQYQNDFNLDQSYFTNKINISRIYTEPFFHYHPIPYNINHEETLDIVGYFQSYKYFEDCEDLIKHIFQFKNSMPKLSNTTSIHVRRTDYLNLPDHHTNLDMSYYNKAMSMIQSEKYLIFSDDISWCKNNFKGTNIEYSEGKSPIDDLQLMSACENNILANSSFSWWAAYLNKNSFKTIIAPQNWFGYKLPHNTKDLCLSTWSRI